MNRKIHLVLMAIVAIGIYLGFRREFSKLVGFLVVAFVAVGLVFNAGGVKDVLLELLLWQNQQAYMQELTLY